MRRRLEVRNHDQRAAIQAVLKQLPKDHPAVRAYQAGTDVIRLMHLVDREDLADELQQAWLDWYLGAVLRQRLR